MKLREYKQDSDMAGRGALAVFYFPDRGVIVRRKSGWYAANDTRWELVGVSPNEDLCQPASGPHPTVQEALATLSLSCKNGVVA